MQSDVDGFAPYFFKFSAVEQFDEAARALGWSVEHRQMSKGSFSAEVTSWGCDGIYLAVARYSAHLHTFCEPPEGFVGLTLPLLGTGRAAAFGCELSDGDLIVFPPGSEVYDDKKGEICYETLFLPEADFSDIARSLAPGHALLSPGSATIYHGGPERLATIQYEIDSVRSTGSLDRESASHLLARTILWMAETPSKSSSEKLNNLNAAHIARRARTYVEEHLNQEIRLEDLCAYAGVGLRTLQRCFASYFQVSPIAYIKARRLNSTRRDLVSADPFNDSVTRIALNNGFSHLGRFSVEYRVHFGESPSETLVATKAQS